MKKALIFALSFALACTLAACGNTGSQTGGTSTDPADTSTPEPADTTPGQNENGNGTEKVITIDDEDGTIYGTITLSSWLDTGNDEFAFADGSTKDWVYWDVGLGGTCTIEPSELIAYTYIHLVGYEQENGVYFLSEEEGTPYHRLFADGEIHNIVFGDQREEPGGGFPTASYGHPACFMFGQNDGGEPNVAGDLDDFTLKADGTMYLLEIEFYGEDGEYLYSCPSPFFVQGDNSTSEPEEASTPVEEPTDTGEPVEAEDTPEPADTTSQPQGSSTSGTGTSTPTEVNTPAPVPTPQQNSDTYEDDPDIDLEVNPRYEYDLNELLDYGYVEWDEGRHFNWQTGEWMD